MKFSLNDEQKMFRTTVKNYIQANGEREVAHHYINNEDDKVEKFWKGLSELGFTGVTVPEQYGGLGMTQVDLIPIMEELGRQLVPGPFLETEGLAVPLLTKFGTEDQKNNYLPKIVSAEETFTIAYCEEDGNYEVNDIQMIAEEAGDKYTLNGIKTVVPFGDTVSTLIVPVRVSNSEGITLLLVNNNDEKIEHRVLNSLDATRRLVEITLNDVQVSKNNVLGNVGNGEAVLQEGLLHLNALLNLTIVGSIEEIVEMAADFANTREQFGQPIGRFQAIKHMIANMKVDLELARSLIYYANWALENNASDYAQSITSARVFANESFIRIAGDNIQVHGGMGFTTELDCHLYFKRAKAWENYLGSMSDYRDLTAKALGW